MAKVDKNIKKYCEKCKKELILKSNRDIFKKRFCSHKYSSFIITSERHKLNQEYTKKIISACNNIEANKKKSLKKEKNPRWKGGNQIHICQICKNLFSITINRHNKGYGKYCSRKCYIQDHKILKVKTSCLNCKKEIIDLPKRNRKYCSCSCRMIHLLPKQKSKETKIELKIKQFLQKTNLQFDYQPRIKDIVNADFLLYPNIVIFADGDYWHSLPKAIKRDNIVNKKLSENNYIILRFKEEEINKHFDLVQNTIMENYNARAK